MPTVTIHVPSNIQVPDTLTSNRDRVVVEMHLWPPHQVPHGLCVSEIVTHRAGSLIGSMHDDVETALLPLELASQYNARTRTQYDAECRKRPCCHRNRPVSTNKTKTTLLPSLAVGNEITVVHPHIGSVWLDRCTKMWWRCTCGYANFDIFLYLCITMFVNYMSHVCGASSIELDLIGTDDLL